MFCPSCGAKNELERTKCFVCGKLLPHAQPAAAQASQPGERRAPRPRAEMGDRAASVGDRMLALLFDRLLLGALALLAVAYVATTNWRAPVSPLTLGIIGALALMLLAFAYHTLAETLAGTTLGKAILGLSVRNEGDHGKLAAIAIRNALRLADGLAGYGVGFCVALFAPRGRRIGDLVAGTVVLSNAVPPAARAVLLLTFAALVGFALWFAWQLCPSCTTSVVERFIAEPVALANR
ncbi:MAG TPA: RDD family protein [Thermoanaerobaculia bacterium]